MLSALALTITAATFAPQQIAPQSGVTLLSSPRVESAFSAAALGVDEVIAYSATIDGWQFGMTTCLFTVKKRGSQQFDIVSGVYDPGRNRVTLNTYADSLNAPRGVGNDMFQGGIYSSGVMCTVDTPAAHPIGKGSAIFAIRNSSVESFGIPVAIAGVPAGMIEPHVISHKQVLSLLFVQGADIMVGDLAIVDPGQSSMTATVSRIRVSVRPPSGAIAVHSPTPLTGYNHETNHLLCSAVFQNGDARPSYSANVEAGRLEARVFGVNQDVQRSPLAMHETGVSVWSSSSSPIRYEMLATSSAKVGVNGGTAWLHTVASPRLSGSTAILLLGVMTPPAGIGPRGLGVLAAGDLSLNVIAALSPQTIVKEDMLLPFWVPAGAIPVGGVVYGQTAVLHATTSEIFTSNNWTIE